MISQKINKLISVCTLKDKETWKISHEFIIKNIDAVNYIVIVPDHEVAEFKTITASPFVVIPESGYLGNLKDQLSVLLPPSRSHQLGWYLQQILKLQAVKDLPKNEVALIWDADTVPICPLRFITAENKILYYVGDENHLPYFDCIKRLLGIEKIASFSFIAQCFPIRSIWMKDFCSEIERLHNIDWISAILKSIDFNEPNGFSEYEALGTFIYEKYFDEIAFSKRAWCRLGNSTIGHPKLLNKRMIKSKATQYDFISFEKWDRAKPYLIKVTIPLILNKIYAIIARYLLSFNKDY